VAVRDPARGACGVTRRPSRHGSADHGRPP
jgi:hypothetical protein